MPVPLNSYHLQHSNNSPLKQFFAGEQTAFYKLTHTTFDYKVFAHISVMSFRN